MGFRNKTGIVARAVEKRNSYPFKSMWTRMPDWMKGVIGGGAASGLSNAMQCKCK